MRPKKPTKLKVLSGTDQPCRMPQNEPQPAHITLPSPPEWLSEYGEDEWYIVTAELEALQLLTKMDLAMLAVYCQQVGLIRQAFEQLKKQRNNLVVETPNGALQPNPLLGIVNKASDVALKIAGQFGFTPSARTRINAPKPKEADPFDAFLTQN